MYFKDRAEAGEQLAERLMKYRYENNIVLCLNEGAVLLGEVIAGRLHCIMTMLLMKDIVLPGESSFGVLDQAGNFTYNDMFSTGQIEEFVTEYHGYMELEKLNKMHEINLLLGDYGIVDRKILNGNNIIVVSDGVKNGTSYDAAAGFLKPVMTHKVIAAVPFASVSAIDRLHILTDEIHCLDVKENYIDTDHYYEDNTIPSSEEIQAKIRNVVSCWC